MSRSMGFEGSHAATQFGRAQGERWWGGEADGGGGEDKNGIAARIFPWWKCLSWRWINHGAPLHCILFRLFEVIFIGIRLEYSFL